MCADPFHRKLPREDFTEYPNQQGPIEHAVRHNYGDSVQSIIQLLSTAGFRTESRFHDEPLLLQYACEHQNYNAALALLHCGAEIPSTLLVSCVSKITAKSDGGYVPDNLVCTAATLQDEVVRRLLGPRYRSSLHINAVYASAESPGTEAETALIRAIREGSYWAVTVLLNFKADPNVQGSKGTTPAKAAVVARDRRTLELLLKNASIDMTDNDGLAAYCYLAPHDVVDFNTAAIWALFSNAGVHLGRVTQVDDESGKFYSFLEYAVYECTQGRDFALAQIGAYHCSNSDGALSRAYDWLEGKARPFECTLEIVHHAIRHEYSMWGLRQRDGRSGV